MGIGLAIGAGAAHLGRHGYFEPVDVWTTLWRGALSASPRRWFETCASTWIDWVFLVLLLATARSKHLRAVQRPLFGRRLGLYVWLGVLGVLILSGIQGPGGLILFVSEVMQMASGRWSLTGEMLSDAEVIRAGLSVVWLACVLRVSTE